MAKKSASSSAKAAAAAAASAAVAQPTADAHPPAAAFVTLWVFTKALAQQLGQPMGFVSVLRSEAAALIAGGGAIDPTAATEPLPHLEGEEPLGWPRPAPAPPAPAPDSPPAPPPPAPPAPPAPPEEDDDAPDGAQE